MKRSIILIWVVFAATFAMAQTQSDSVRVAIKDRLSQPMRVDSVTMNNNTIRLAEQGDAATIVEQNLYAKPKSVSGYRIVIFMSNTQSARRDALAAQESFSQQFPSERAYLSYDNPYFKVAVGNYTSQEEAIILLGRIRQLFPKAFLTRESISVGEFAK